MSGQARSSIIGKAQAAEEAAREVRRKTGQDKNISSANIDAAARKRVSLKKSSAPVKLRRTQEERRAESEEKLLAAAVHVLARKGWIGMTLAEVGEVAGYSRGQATHQFGSKTALLRAIVFRAHRMISERMLTTPSVDGLQAVLKYVSMYVSRSNEEWVNVRANLLLRAETLLEDSEIIDVLEESTRPIVSWLELNLRIGITNGEVRSDVDPVLGAEFVMGLMRGVAQQYLSEGRTDNLHKNRKQWIRLVEKALAVPVDREEVKLKR